MKKKTTSIFLAALLLAIVFQTSFIRRYYPVLAQEEVMLSAWTGKPPKIDGIIGDEEWSTAAKIDFNIASYNGTIYVMNDGGNLYIAAKITDNYFQADQGNYDVFMVLFDNDNDGVQEKGDDGLFCFSIAGPPYDVFYNVTEPNAWPSDESDGGTADGGHDETGDGVYNYFECFHPLDSADDAHDFSLKIGDVVGFRVGYYDNKTLIGFWPSGGWRHIKIASGDLVLSDDDVYTITGNYYMNGSIVVTENATLVMKDALVTFTQTSSYYFNVTLKDAVGGNPRLIIDNATINTNTYLFPIMLQENSTAHINGMRLATNSYISLILYESSHATINNSTFGEVRAYHSSTLNFAYSSATMVDVDDESHLNMENANVYVLYGVGNAEAQVKDSTIIYTLGIEANTTQCIINETKPGLIAKWNFLENCSVTKGTGGFAPNVTLTNVQVNGWGFVFKDSVNTVLYNSMFTWLVFTEFAEASAYNIHAETVSLNHYSRVNATDSNVDGVELYGQSVIWAVNSTATSTQIYGQAMIYVNWYLDVHVVDYFGQDVPDANVTVACSDGSTAAVGRTNGTGWVRLTVLSSIINATGEYPQGPHNVTATYETYSNKTTVNVNGNKQAAIVLSDFIIPEFPQMLPAIMLSAAPAIALLRNSKNTRKKH